MLANRRFSAYLPWLLILLIVIVSFTVYFVGLNRYKAPPGCDYGNYLTQVEILRGNDLRGWGLRHNPVFFVMLDIFLRLFEEFTALKIVASLVFAVIAIPFFLLARKLSGSRLVAVICTWLFVFFISNSENEMVELTLLSMQIPQISINSILAIGEYWAFFVVAIVFVLGLFALSRYVKDEHRNNGLLLCSLFLSPLILALITDHPIRWVYFIPIPLTLCFGIYLRDLFFDIKNSRKTIRLLAICFIAIIGFHTTVMTFYHLRSATEVYQFIENDEIQVLNWIKANTAPDATLATSGHPKGDIGGGGNSYAWWIEGYCKRVCVCSGDLKYYSYQKEQDEVRIANRIFAGTYSAEYENLRVTESYPSSTTNPEIAAFIDNDYQEVLALNDAQHQLFFSPNENEQELSVAAFYSENRTSSIKYGDTWANITVTYEQPYFELIRSIIIGEEKSSVDVVFQILPKNSLLRLFKVNLWALFDTSLEECEIGKDYVVSLSQVTPKEWARTQITVLETNGNLEGARVLFEDPKESKPVISYSFEPLQDSLYVCIRIFTESSTEDTDDTQTLHFYDSYDLIKDLHIDYILINRYRASSLVVHLARQSKHRY